jgi:CRP/FNR family transcriptional regulator
VSRPARRSGGRAIAGLDADAVRIGGGRQGALMGIASILLDDYVIPGSIQSVADTELLVLRPATLRALSERDLTVARFMILELSDRVVGFSSALPGTAFSTVRQRVARHLLDLASEHQRGRELLAQISQQELADAVGTVREVSCVLRDLRSDGLVRHMGGHRDRRTNSPLRRPFPGDHDLT